MPVREELTAAASIELHEAEKSVDADPDRAETLAELITTIGEHLSDSSDPIGDLKEAVAILTLEKRELAKRAGSLASDLFLQNVILYAFGDGQTVEERLRSRFPNLTDSEIDGLIPKTPQQLAEQDERDFLADMERKGHRAAAQVIKGGLRLANLAREEEKAAERAKRSKGGKKTHAPTNEAKQRAIADWERLGRPRIAPFVRTNWKDYSPLAPATLDKALRKHKNGRD